MIEVVALARALADAGEHRIAAMRLGDVVDQLLDQHRLADAGAAEEADLAALGIGREQVDDLDAGDEHLGFGGLGGEIGRGRMDRAVFGRLDGTLLVDRLADDVEDAPQRAVADRDLDRLAGIGDLRAAHEAFGRIHRDGAHGGFAQVLRDLEHEPLAVVVGLERVEDLGQMVLELHVDDGADDLGDLADCWFSHVVLRP